MVPGFSGIVPLEKSLCAEVEMSPSVGEQRWRALLYRGIAGSMPADQPPVAVVSSGLSHSISAAWPRLDGSEWR
jgi:hypothetical protein